MYVYTYIHIYIEREREREIGLAGWKTSEVARSHRIRGYEHALLGFLALPILAHDAAEHESRDKGARRGELPPCHVGELPVERLRPSVCAVRFHPSIKKHRLGSTPPPDSPDAYVASPARAPSLEQASRPVILNNNNSSSNDNNNNNNNIHDNINSDNDNVLLKSCTI